MIKINKYFLLFLIAGVSMQYSCKKDDKCEAGTGGNLKMLVRLKHHGVTIPNDSLRPDTVWIKYNVKDWSSAPAGANLMIIGEPGEDHIHVTGMQCGDYYFYAAGWDVNGPYEVRGGRPISTDLTEGELPVEIAVSE